MASVLYISASPKGRESASARIANAFLEEYFTLHSGDTRVSLSLFDHALPEFGAIAVEAKFAPIFGEPLQQSHRDAWRAIENEIDKFKAADKVVLATPMWNLGVPYKLKHYIDILVQPLLTFGYDRERMIHVGLVKNKPLQLILTRSSVMPGDFSDFQLPYLKYIFEFIGIHDIRVLTAWQTTQSTPEGRESYVVSFFEAAREAARTF